MRSNSKLGQVSSGPSSPSIRDHFRTEELCNQAISYRLGLPSTLSSFSIDRCMLIPDKILAACNYSGLIINTRLGFFSVFIQRSSCRRLQLSAPSSQQNFVLPFPHYWALSPPPLFLARPREGKLQKGYASDDKLGVAFNHKPATLEDPRLSKYETRRDQRGSIIVIKLDFIFVFVRLKT